MTDPDPHKTTDDDAPQDSLDRSLAPVGRIIGYLLAWWIAVAIATSFVFPLVADLRPTDLRFLTVVSIPQVVATVLVTWVFVRLVDQRPIETLGLARCGSWLRELSFGVLLGLVLTGLVFLISLALDWTDITGSLFSSSAGRIAGVVVQTLIVMSAIAVAEEVAVRGYLLQTLRRGYGAVSAIVVSSLLFGLLHLMNPGAGLSAFWGTLAAGVVLGYSYLATERLWLPIGLHFGWNFALGPIFGFPVSGIEMPGWVMLDSPGPALWIGGRFGPEAGLLGITAFLAGIPAVLLFRRMWYRRGQVEAETLRRPSDDEMRGEDEAA